MLKFSTVQTIKCIGTVSMCVRMHESLLVISPEKKVQWHKKWDFCEFHNIEQIKTEEKWGFIDKKQSIRSSSL